MFVSAVFTVWAGGLHSPAISTVTTYLSGPSQPGAPSGRPHGHRGSLSTAMLQSYQEKPDDTDHSRGNQHDRHAVIRLVYKVACTS